MINDIIKGVAITLNTAFKGKYKIYQNDVEQGLELPCFLILTLAPSVSPLLMNRYMEKVPLDVHFIPETGRDNAALLDMAADLAEALEFITLPGGDLLHGTSMSAQIEDDVLHFFVSYNRTLYRRPDETKMEELELDANTKGR